MEEGIEHAIVVAIVRCSALEAAESNLQEIGVRGFTVVAARGRGSKLAPGHNFLAWNALEDEVKIEA